MPKGGQFILPVEQLPVIFAVEDFTEEHLMIQQMIKDFVAAEVASDEAVEVIEAKNWNFVWDFSRNLLKKLGELGLLGAEIPEIYGGQGLDKITGAIIAEEIAKEGSFACTFLAHTGIGTLPVRFFGTEEQKKKYLPRLVSGEWVAAYCLTDTEAGSDADGVKAQAVPSNDGGNYILNGEKIFVTNGGFADLFVVFAKIPGAGLTAFILEKTFPGVTTGKQEHKMGIEGSSTTTVVLDNVVVPSDNLLGESGKGLKIALNILNLGRFKLGAASLGAGKMCLEESLEYARDRKQFGQSIGNFGAIREKLAQMAVKIFAMEAIVYRTAGHLEEAISQVDTADAKAVLNAIGEFAVECSLVKVFCSEALDFIVDENVQIHGGSGYCEGNSERHYRDARINRIFEGTNEINRLLAVDMLLKKALKTKDLPLMAEVKKVVNETISASLAVEPLDLEDRLIFYLNNAKKAVLFAAGAAFQKFMLTLKDHQIILLDLSDCLISVYVMESGLAVWTKKKSGKKEKLVRALFHEHLLVLEKTTKEIVVMSTTVGDEQKTQLAMLRRILKFSSENKEELYNKIVEDLD